MLGNVSGWEIADSVWICQTQSTRLLWWELNKNMLQQQPTSKRMQWLTSLSSNRFMGPLFQIWKQRYATKIHSSYLLSVTSVQPQKVIPLEEVFLKKYVRNEKMISSQRLSRDLAMDVMTIGISSIGCASAWYADGHGFNPHVRQNILS